MMLVLTILGGLALAGPADRALHLMDAPPHRAPAAAHQVAAQGAKLPRKITRRITPRASAWLSVGRLGILDDEILGHARTALMTSHNPGPVRARAAWALGEVGRGRTWEEVTPVAVLLEEAMASPLDGETAHQVIEAFAKVYTPHSHTFAENLAATRALNTLGANQTRKLPGVYSVVLDQVLTFDVAVRLVRERVDAARQAPSDQTLAEAYGAVLLTIRWLAGRQDQLLAGLSDHRTAVTAAFDALLSTLDLNDRRLTLMLLWSLGEVAGDPAFAELVGPRTAALARTQDPAVRAMQAWALYRLRSNVDARKSLRDDVLATETDPMVLRLLAALRSSPRELDAIQKLYAVEPRPAAQP